MSRLTYLLLALAIIAPCAIDLVTEMTHDRSRAAGIEWNAERNRLEIIPEADARDYCYRPTTEPFLWGTGCRSRIPTAEKPYCPMGGN
jgi:hypothetical protein